MFEEIKEKGEALLNFRDVVFVTAIKGKLQAGERPEESGGFLLERIRRRRT